jgi:predicted RNA-binding protein with RPS1 domain
MVHLSDLDWKRPGEQVIDYFKKGDKVRAQVLDVDIEKERISLGVKQLEGDPFAEAGDVKKGAVVTCEITEVKESGLEVKLVGTDLTAFIKRSELAATVRTAHRTFRRRRRSTPALLSSIVALTGDGLDQGARSPRRRGDRPSMAPPIPARRSSILGTALKARHRERKMTPRVGTELRDVPGAAFSGASGVRQP